MRVLVTTAADPADPEAPGLAAYVGALVRAWAAAGHAVTVLTGATGAPTDEPPDGVRVVRLARPHLAAATWWANRDRAAYDLVVDAGAPRPFGATRWPGAPPGVVVVPEPVHRGGSPLRGLRHTPVVALSEEAADAVRRVGGQRVVTVAEGLAPATTTRPGRRFRRPTLVWADRLVASRRPHDALAVLGEARRAVPGTRLLVLGDGPLAEDLQAAARRAGLPVRVADPPVHARRALIGRSHLRLLTGPRTGWRTDEAEAALLRVPVAAYAGSGWDPAADHGGLLTAATPEALGAAVATALPALLRARPPAGPGGTLDWDLVAEAVLDRIAEQAEVVRPADRPAARPAARRSRRGTAAARGGPQSELREDPSVVVDVEVPVDEAELAVDLAFLLGATAVAERPGDRPGTIVLTTELPDDADLGVLRWTTHPHRPAPVEEPPRASVTVGPVTVHHPDDPAHRPDGPGPSGRVVVAVDPAGAFGHGGHPTTRLALAAVVAAARPGTRVLDVGSGTGVLAVVAAVLGASVVAVDTDPAAVAATLANARRNGVADRVVVGDGPPAATGAGFDLVVANLLLADQRPLAPVLPGLVAPGGRLALTGLLPAQLDELLAAMPPWPVVRDRLGDWAAATLERQAPVSDGVRAPDWA